VNRRDYGGIHLPAAGVSIVNGNRNNVKIRICSTKNTVHAARMTTLKLVKRKAIGCSRMRTTATSASVRLKKGALEDLRSKNPAAAFEQIILQSLLYKF